MFTIGVDQLLSNSALYEHINLENIKKLYTSARKCEDQQQYKTTLKAVMLSTPKVFTDKSPMSPVPSVTVKDPSARKSIH